jgi:hypothetical protein
MARKFSRAPALNLLWPAAGFGVEACLPSAPLRKEAQGAAIRGSHP